MDDFKELLANNKKAAALIVVVILVFIGASAARFAYIHTPTPEALSQNNSSQARSAEKDGEQGRSEDVQLSAEQQALKSAYTDEIKTFVALLSSNVWTAGSETVALAFSQDAFTESKDGKAITRTYAVSALRQENVQTAGASNAYTQSYIASILVDGETYIVKASCVHTEKDTSAWVVASDCFSKAKSYTRSAAAQNFEIEGATEDFEKLLGGKEQVAKLTSALKEYCAQYYPTAKKAVWDAGAEIDYTTQSVMLKFKLDNQSKASLAVNYSLAAKSFEIGKAA